MAYKILTLDGGGAWALIEVMALIDLYGEDTYGNEVLKDFDLVAANSGGSIVLGGLVENVKLGTLLDYFLNGQNRLAIFSPTSSVADKVLEGVLHLGPKYSALNKLPALEKLMPQTGNTPIAGINHGLVGPAGAPVRLMIVGFDYSENRATFFRSSPPTVPCLGVANAPGITMAEAIHSSTNAPINYFDAPATFPQRPDRYWDGGISGYNNPVLAAVTEAVLLGVQPRDIAALSLGTGTVHLPVAGQGAPASPYTTPYVTSSLLTDLTKLASAILDDPPDSASFIAHAMTGAGAGLAEPLVSRIVRANPVIAPGADDTGQPAPPAGLTVAQFQQLCGIGMDAVVREQVLAIAGYAKLWLLDEAPNQLLHSDNVNAATDIGYPTYSEARRAWELLLGTPLRPPFPQPPIVAT